jgi:hypothetical protein
MAYLTDYQYYDNNGQNPTNINHGSYQYVSLKDIVNNFQLNFTGDHSLINNEPRHKIVFHAKKAIQELNYDALKEVKSLEIDISEQLKVVLPPDYVNWVRISLYKDGLLQPMTENIQAMASTTYLKDNSGGYIYDQDGNILSPEFSKLELDRIAGTKKSIYLDRNSNFYGREGWNIDGSWYFDYRVGARFGLNAETANSNPTFRIDKKSGVIDFSSGVQGDLVVLEYISDGMEKGQEMNISVNKMFEDYMYAEIEYRILKSKIGVQEYIVRRSQKSRKALWNNAKIRMGGLHPSRLLMSLRSQQNWIK